MIENNNGKINIEFEVITNEQKPYVEKITNFANKNNYNLVKATYGNKPQYSDLNEAPVYKLELNTDKHKENKYQKKTIVFGFPGNPISTFVNCLAYFYPWYYKSVGLQVEEETAILSADVTFKPSLTYFLQVKLNSRFGHLIATPITGNGSGDLASLVHTDAFIQLPNDKTEFKKGEVFPIIRYR